VDFVAPKEALETLTGPLTPGQVALLDAYGVAIQEASGSVNLFSRLELGNLGEHLIDSGALLRFRDSRSGSLADLGSGAGLPGMVVAILRPGVSVTLVESRRPKVVFLKSVIRELGLGNVRVCHGRIEDLSGRESFDTVAVRAIEKPLEMLPHCLALVGPGGALVLFKGPRWEQEADEVSRVAEANGFAVARIESVALPGTQRSTLFVELSRGS
jgi:16S rRNA (guanine527-N7)-methyltransferase